MNLNVEFAGLSHGTMPLEPLLKLATFIDGIINFQNIVKKI
jgi:hypothetical protein